MGYRHRSEITVKYGRLGEYLALIGEFNRVGKERQWSPITVLSPITGRNNRVVLEIVHADLASFERALAEFRNDETARSIWHRTAEMVVEGSANVELLNEVVLTQ